MTNITFADEKELIQGKEITWESLDKAVEDLGGVVDKFYVNTKVVEIEDFEGVFLKDDFSVEKHYALDNGLILAEGDLIERGYRIVEP